MRARHFEISSEGERPRAPDAILRGQSSSERRHGVRTEGAASWIGDFLPSVFFGV